MGRSDWLGTRRYELVERMHRRSARDTGAGYGKSSGYASGKRTYADRGLRPGLFSAG